LLDLIRLGRTGQPYQRVYVCLSEPVLCLKLCLDLVQKVGFPSDSIYVKLSGEGELSHLVRNPLPGLTDAGQIRFFDLFEQTCSPDLLMSGSREMLARDLHAVYSAGIASSQTEQRMGLPWDQLPEETREANREQAYRIGTLLQAAGYELAPLQDWAAGERRFSGSEIDQMAHLEHTLWRQTKETHGWRFGARRSEDQRTHPDLVPWETLADEEREKNRAFVRQLPGLLARVGFQVDRAQEPK